VKKKSGNQLIRTLSLRISGPGLHEITEDVEGIVRESGVTAGLATLFVQHTSASLLIQENADLSAKHDLERWLARLVPDNDPLYTHTREGVDDMPAHLKAALTPVSIGIPVVDGRLALGTWQGIYLWEHRRNAGVRNVVVQVGG
jgi:secondary thiamine-phosphate synthase enzyme